MNFNPDYVGMDACLAALSQRFTPKVIFDVGASDGQWSRLAMAQWPQADYHLFEPLPAFYNTLSGFCQLDPERRHWFPEAAGYAKRRVTLNVGKDPYISSLCYPGESTVDVQMIRLSDYCLDRDLVPDLVKIDVQGSELRVVEGLIAQYADKSRDLLTFTKSPTCPLILMEVPFYRFSESMTPIGETINRMARWNYRVYDIAGALRRPRDNAMGQCDILFVKNGHALLDSASWT